MTDTTNFAPNSQAITSDLNFQLKPSGVRSRSYRASILPTNKTAFAPTETCIIYIPGGRRNTYLDCSQSYMRMTVKNTDAVNAFKLDVCAFSLINRIDIFHGGNLLETIQSYNQLAIYILDMQSSMSNRLGLGNMYGFDATGDRSGLNFAVGAQYTCCLPIFSGVVGTLSDKMLPLGLLSDDIRLEITFKTASLGVVAAAGTPQYSILDFQLELTIVELSDEGENMVRSNYSYPETPLYLHGSSWRHYTSNLPALSAGGFATLVPARFASLKQIACMPRRSVEIASVTSYGLGSRVNPNISYYWFRIGSAIVPSKAKAVFLEGTNTGGYSEAYAELLKSWHDLHTVSNSTCLGLEYQVADAAIANCPQIAVATNTGVTSYKNGFVIAIELESFAQRNDVLLSGMNTLSSQIFFEATINTAIGAGSGSYTLDFFAWYDHILVLDRGILSVKI